MDRCKEQLRTLSSAHVPMAQAAENLLADIQTPDNPHGNVPPALSSELEGACSKFDVHECGHVADAVKTRQTVRRGDLRSPTTPPASSLRICLSRTTIAAFHVNSGSIHPYAGAASAAAAHDLDLTPGTQRKIGIVEMQGTTGRAEAPTWWTFPLDAQDDRPGDGRTYMEELALSDREMELARRDGAVVEVEIPFQAFPLDFYKPSAVDAFDPFTRFRPDLGPAPHGWTAPLRAGQRRRPEVITRSVGYAVLSTLESEITLTVLPFESHPNVLPFAANRP